MKDGTWRVITRTESTGDEQCASPAETDTADVVQCDLDLGLGGETGFSTNCDVTPNGQNFTFACSGEASFPPCTINFNISGSGHQALDNYELNGTLILSTGGASTTFASLPCTTMYAVLAPCRHQ